MAPGPGEVLLEAPGFARIFAMAQGLSNASGLPHPLEYGRQHLSAFSLEELAAVCESQSGKRILF